MDLNPFLQSNNSPLVVNTSFSFDKFDFGNNVMRDSVTTLHLQNASITNAKIGSLAVQDGNILSLSANKLTAGTVLVSVNVGSAASGYVLIDGVNNRILVNDGTTNRIVIGNV